MRIQNHPINLNLDTLMDEELPWTQAFYREANSNELKQDVREYFQYATEHAHNMPFYVLQQSACAKIETIFERTYACLHDAVGLLFKENRAVIERYMGSELLAKHPEFLDYARWTYTSRSSHKQPIYGRFDAAFDPATNEVTGIYEFNGDTPTMLFESVNLQTLLCKQVTGDEECQLNSLWPLMDDLFGQLGQIPGHSAVVFHQDSFEDMATCETIAQIMSQINPNVFFVDINELDFDHSEPSKPFVFGDYRLDAVFILHPWEEMVEAAPSVFANWGKWCQNVTFFEPAWRWFASNKGIWAYITEVMKFGGLSQYADLPLLKTYMEPSPFINTNAPYVSKPNMGRMSANVTIHTQTGEAYTSEGPYDGTTRVYQEFCPAHQLNGRNDFIIGMFVVPDEGGATCTAATLCIREFNGKVVGWHNERWIPHYLE